MVHTAAMEPARKVTCSVLAIMLRPACQGETDTVMSQMMPMVTAYITASKTVAPPVPAMLPWKSSSWLAMAVSLDMRALSSWLKGWAPALKT